MSPNFAVLASGSSANASLLRVDDYGILIDFGLGPRALANRLAAIDASWRSIDAVLLTHTHADHWKEGTLSRLLEHRIPLYCHRSHQRQLRASSAFAGLRNAQLVRFYESASDFSFLNSLRCQPVPVSHDGGATFGFRFERSADLFGRSWAMGYASDLGCWDGDVIAAFRNVDLLALEFNHDVQMQQFSGRSRWLIERVLGARGHLSNEQAAELLADVLRESTPGRLQQVVQLHLSRQCNRPAFAHGAASAVLSELAPEVCVSTASQTEPLLVEPLAA